MPETTIYHNPNCGTSQKVLAMLREAGLEPRIIEYLRAPPTHKELVSLLTQMGMRPRDILRRKDSVYQELGLDDLSLGDDAVIDAILSYPVLLERPIVITPKGVGLCRPAETVKRLL